MNILADNPVFQREARWGRRLRRLRQNKPLAVMASLVALTVGWLYWRGLMAYADPSTAYDNGGLWRLCSGVFLGLIVLLAPALASSAISQEKEQQTWEALATTRLSPAQILLGKWLGRLVLIGWIGLLLLPLLLIGAGGADLPPLTILIVFGFFALNAALYGMIGLVCSFVARKTLAATTVALVIPALLCLGTWVIGQLFFGLTQGGGDWALMTRYSGLTLPSPLWLNPFHILSLLTTHNEAAAGWRSFYGQVPQQQIYYQSSQGYYVGNAALYGGDYGFGDRQSGTALHAVTFYCVTALAIIALCFYYMFTRYRRTVRGGRPLGDPLT